MFQPLLRNAETLGYKMPKLLQKCVVITKYRKIAEGSK